MVKGHTLHRAELQCGDQWVVSFEWGERSNEGLLKPFFNQFWVTYRIEYESQEWPELGSMRHRINVPVLNVIIGAVTWGAACFVILLPAWWLSWEAEAARLRAETAADAEIYRVEHDLADLFSRFERATSWVRAQDVTSDKVAITGRLLRAEPLASPASGFAIFNSRGVQIASSSVSAEPVNSPPAWFRSQPLPQPGRTMVLGCGGAPSVTNWLLVRSVEVAAETGVRLVASALPESALRSLLRPDSRDTGPLTVALRTSAGCELVRNNPVTTVWQPASPFLREFMRRLPSGWMGDTPLVTTRTIGNVIVSVTARPADFLALRNPELDARGTKLTAGLFGFSTLLLVLGFTTVALPRRSAPLGKRGEPARNDPKVTTNHETTRRELDEIVVERDRVLAAIGHDVRTPISSILGICALLMDGHLDETQRKWLRCIRASCEGLLAMLNGMLEIAAARVDGSEVNLETLNVASLIEDVAGVLRPQAEDKGLDLKVVLGESLLGTWQTDPTRLRQILFNLCGNAIKYTFRGSVELAAAVEGNETGGRQLCLRVTDTGMGIAEDEREHIFGQFKRGRDEVSRGQEGLGLGLALCRDIASLLKGTLSLDSTVGVGSSFSFVVPIQRAEGVVGAGGPLAGRSALVVGLPDGVRRRIASHLESMGMEVDTAIDGFLAVGLAERMAYKRGVLDLMILDAVLPGLSAEALLARLQGIGALEHMRTVLVADGCVAAGGRADAVVSHPVETRELDAVVAGLFGDSSIPREVYPRSPTAPSRRVLVVEDNRINQALFIDKLTRAGFSAFAASNGREAVEAISRGGFDAVLMDIQMPEIGGVEATRRIRVAERVGHRVPIIGMTAHTGASIRRDCLEAGMDLVLHKPIDFVALPQQVREVIQMHKVDVGASIKPAPLPVRARDVNPDRLRLLVAEFGTDRAAVCVSEFLHDTSLHVTRLADNVAAGRWMELSQLAHSLAGLAATLGAGAFADRLLMLDDAVCAEDSEQAMAIVREVLANWEHTRVALRNNIDQACANELSSKKPTRAFSLKLGVDGGTAVADEASGMQ